MAEFDVFDRNFVESISTIEQKVRHYGVISLDTEFPGCLRVTPRDAPSYRRYKDMRLNVLSTKLIQVGMTLSDDNGNVGGSWQFNLSDFVPESDNHALESIALLRSSGIDFERFSSEGVRGSRLAMWLEDFLMRHRQRLKWVTFHGLYDLGYLVAMVTRQPLPADELGFHFVVRRMFGRWVYDLKVVAEGNGFRGYGLERLARHFGVSRSAGMAHQAGSDSLLTAELFGKLRQMGVRVESFEGFVYGIDGSIRVPDACPAPVPCVMLHRPAAATCVMVQRPMVYCVPPFMGFAADGGGGRVYGV